jgi:predicted Ser/Thr protein kinase
MRFASSKAIAASAVSGKPSQGGLHYKKDGTLDMRYSSSKRVEMERQMGELLVSPGSGAASAGPSEEYHSAREAYYQALAEQNETYRRLVEQLADRAVPCTGTEVLPSSNTVAAYLKAHSLSTCEPMTPAIASPASTAQAAEQAAAVEAARLESVTSALPSSIRQLTKAEVDTAIAGQEELGKGAFGLVYKGRLDDRDVAVKVLFVSQLQRNERGAFEKELIILGHLGTHVNLVQLHAYSLEKPAFVMELVALGSLHHNLYFNNDETVTATLGTSGTKKKILVGILSGIIQLHHVGIVHGNLKPHNVLLTEDYVAKITDFGLSRLRAKASSLTGL